MTMQKFLNIPTNEITDGKMVNAKKLLMNVPYIRLAIIVADRDSTFFSSDDLPSMLPSEATTVCVVGCFLASLVWACQRMGKLEESEDPFESGSLVSRFKYVKSTAHQGAFEINARDIRNVMES
jgi:hypothetical protein